MRGRGGGKGRTVSVVPRANIGLLSLKESAGGGGAAVAEECGLGECGAQVKSAVGERRTEQDRVGQAGRLEEEPVCRRREGNQHQHDFHGNRGAVLHHYDCRRSLLPRP